MLKKKLFIRFSSLGDIILASSVLDFFEPADFLTSKKFDFVLKAHPAIRCVYHFDSHQGIYALFLLARRLRQEKYDQIIDLHGSLRSRLLLFFLCFLDGKKNRPEISRVSKQKVRFLGQIGFKSLWPKQFRPEHWLNRFAQAAHTPKRAPVFHWMADLEFAKKWQKDFPEMPFFCVMPSSVWKAKTWNLQGYFDVIKALYEKKGVMTVVLGTQKDILSAQLIALLRERQIPCVSAIDWNLSQVAGVLKIAKGLLTVDTGMAHLSQSLGVKTWILFGPTSSDLGYAPWQPNAFAVEVNLACRPCSKDGAVCLRFWEPYACFHRLSAQTVLDKILHVW